MKKTVAKTQEKLTPEQLIGKLFHGKAFSSEVKVASDNERTLLVKISSINPDRSNDIVEPQGCDLTNYKKNPVVLLSHNYQSLPIAKCTDIQILDDSIMAKVLFPDVGVYEVSDVVYTMCKEGFLNGWSIGFIPDEYTERKDDNGWGYTFTKWQLLEFSAVSVPDNQDALTIMRSKGINVDVLENEHTTEEAEAAVKTLDNVETPVEEEREQEEAGEVETKEIDAVVKEGRALSSANQTHLQNAIDSMQSIMDAHSQMTEHMQKAMDSMNSMMASNATTSDGQEEEAQEAEKEATSVIEKEAKPITNTESSLLLRLSQSLKKTDKEVGLTLRLLKNIQSESKKEGGEK